MEKKFKDSWDFVEENYPDYHRCDFIAYTMDLHKILNNEFEDDDGAGFLLRMSYGGRRDHPNISSNYFEALCYVYDRAIRNHISQSN